LERNWFVSFLRIASLVQLLARLFSSTLNSIAPLTLGFIRSFSKSQFLDSILQLALYFILQDLSGEKKRYSSVGDGFQNLGARFFFFPPTLASSYLIFSGATLGL